MSDGTGAGDVSSKNEAGAGEEGSGKAGTKNKDFWFAVFQSQTGDNIKVDFEKLAQLVGYKNAASAQASYNYAKKKAILSREQVKNPTPGTSTAPVATEKQAPAKKAGRPSAAKTAPAKVTKAAAGGAKRGRKPKHQTPVAPAATVKEDTTRPEDVLASSAEDVPESGGEGGEEKA